MTDKDVQKLKRAELLEMLLEQSKEVERLKSELQSANEKLENRKICLEKAGSIADASLLLNGIFDAAQLAAQQYLENIQYLNDNQERICDEMMQKCREKCEKMERETAEACKKQLEEAALGAQARWDEISTKLQNFYDAHQGLREVLALVGEKMPEV